MRIIIKSSRETKEFKNKTHINIGTNHKCDFVLNLNYDLLLSVQCDSKNKCCQVINNFKSPNIIFKGEILQKLIIDSNAKLIFKNSDEFIEIKFIPEVSTDILTNKSMNLSDGEIKALYGEEDLSGVKAKLEKAREPIEKARILIIKEIAYPIAELSSKIKVTGRINLLMHISLYITSLLCAFAIANYLMGLTAQEAAKHIYLTTNIQAWVAYSFVVFACCLMLKQGIFLYLTEKNSKKVSGTTKLAKNFMLWISAIFIIGIYAVNLTYYSAMSEFMMFAIFLTIFFVGIMTALAIACGYFKANGAAYSAVLHKYEFREDFETVLKTYRVWIERYVNSLSKPKLDNIKDRMFMLHLKSFGEIIIGILTAPFLAYGVSNTLAICFPEAAGWVRISGMRFSPIFLVLATFLIIFAFFGFVNAFFVTKKIQASQVIKQDGFNDYRHHGVTIYGLEGVRKLESEKRLFLSIACSIVFIEFMMNISYFMTEIGGDVKGAFLSFVAALVPTALLIAETLMLSGTKFDIYACDELIAKLDKE